jgi:hypothetical protein
VEWSRVATTTYASHLGCDQAMHEEAYPKKKAHQKNIKKKCASSTTSWYTLDFFTIDAFLQFQFFSYLSTWAWW